VNSAVDDSLQAALVGGQRERAGQVAVIIGQCIGPGINRRAAGQRQDGLRGAAVVGQRAEQGRVPDDVAAGAIRKAAGAGGVVDQVVGAELRADRGAAAESRIVEVERVEDVAGAARGGGGVLGDDGVV